jgi:hypothetical protein
MPRSEASRGGCPTRPAQIGEHVLKRQYDLKLKEVDCRKLLSVDKSPLTKREQGKHKRSLEYFASILRFVGVDSRQYGYAGIGKCAARAFRAKPSNRAAARADLGYA